jgi:hypothetical protein
LTEVQRQLGTKHNFTTAYCPWANGTVDAVCKQSIRAARAMLSEMHLAPQEWPRILPAIHSVLNNSPSSHRAGQTPLTAFTGHARDSPLALTMLHPTANKSLPFIKAQQLAEITKFTTQVEQLHKEVSTQVSRQRKKQMEAHNARRYLVQRNFHPGDYVLRAVPKLRQHKLSLTWKGPYVVVNVYPNNTLRLRSLIKDVTFITHVTRTCMSRDSDHAQRQDMSAVQLTAEFNHYVPYVFKRFGHFDVDKKTGDMSVWTEWNGFDEIEGTMEPLYEKWIDVSQMLTAYLQRRAYGDELALKAMIKVREFETDQGDHRPCLRRRHQPCHLEPPEAPSPPSLMQLTYLHVSCYGALLCEIRTRVPNLTSITLCL